MPAIVRSSDGTPHAAANRRTTQASANSWRLGSAGGFVLRCPAFLAAWLLTTSLYSQSIEHIDSGWSVARPPRSSTSSSTTDPQPRILLDHVLTNSNSVARKAISSSASEGAPRVADRTATNAGWRSVGSAAASGSISRAERDETETPIGPTLGPSGDAAPELRTGTAATPTLEFRMPHVGAGRPIGRTTNDPSTDVRRPDPLPTDELAPALPPGSIELRRHASNEPADRSRLIANEPNGDDLPESTRPTNDDSAEEETADEPLDVDALTNADDGALSDQSPATPPAAKPPTAAPPPLPPQLTNLRNRLRSVLRGYYQKSLNSQEHDPWEVMHGMLSYGIHSRIRQTGPRGEHITAVGWLCYNRPCKSKNLLYVTQEGELRAKQGVGLQGHMGQLLAMLAQCHVSPEYPIRVGAHEFTIQDLIEAEKKTCYPKSELTFKLIAFAHYLDLDATWVNDQGLDWDFPRLIREELAQPIRGAACGGTHRLAGLSLAVKAREKSGAPIDGEYVRAAEFVKNYQNYAFRMQNRDGSLSTKWFQGTGDENDIDRRVKTTGHILEWLIYSQTDEQLREPRTIRAVTYLTNLLYSNYDHEWEIGPRSHAIHALLLYDERVFRPFDPAGQTVISPIDQPATGSRRSSSRR